MLEVQSEIGQRHGRNRKADDQEESRTEKGKGMQIAKERGMNNKNEGKKDEGGEDVNEGGGEKEERRWEEMDGKVMRQQ